MTYYSSKYVGILSTSSEENNFFKCIVLDISSEDNTPSLIRYYKFLPVFISDKYKIIKASFFNEHSKFFYYLILKDNKYYVGVFDYIYSLIIFHSELISNEYMNVFSITNSYHLLLSNYTIFFHLLQNVNIGLKEIPILNIYSHYCKEASKKNHILLLYQLIVKKNYYQKNVFLSMEIILIP